MTLPEWNALPDDQAISTLLSCCGAPLWAKTLAESRPCSTVDALIPEAQTLWFAQPEAEWLAAFACHPRIGQRDARLTSLGAAGAQFADWSGTEQRSAQATLEAVSTALIEANRAYERKFGFLYIVFASGRTAPELLAILEHRLDHDRATELHEAARQQWAITNLRLGKLFEENTAA
jgi:2-oxo-4-hydroxy-4-carboxy-5-ureidoimidazoline decarboxylase